MCKKAIIVIVSSLFFWSCSGSSGGGGGTDTPAQVGTAPKISSVSIEMKKIITFKSGIKMDSWEEENIYPINTQARAVINANDPDLDIMDIEVTQYYAADGKNFKIYYGPDIVHTDSQPSEYVKLATSPPTTITGPEGLWRIDIQLIDKNGNESNIFVKHITVSGKI